MNTDLRFMQENMPNTLIGIDLGTTNSLCAVFEDGQPLLIPNAHGRLLTPSIVGVLEDQKITVGNVAKELRITQPTQTAWCFKRLMGTEEKTKVGPYNFTAAELSSLVLKSLKEDAEKFLGHSVTEAVITVPAYFNDFQRKATKVAGEMAGLKVRRIINEPTAAALTYGFHQKEEDKNLLVFDLGGGTFDVTIMEIFEESLEIMSTAGESQLGGEDFTEKIIEWACKQVDQDSENVRLDYPDMYARLLEEAENAKRKIGEEDEVTIRIPQQNGSLDEARQVLLTKATFLKEVDTLMQKLAKPVLKAMRDAELNADRIDEIILVGGATRMPIIKDFIYDTFGKDALCKYNPDQVVARGAAVQAALIEDDAAVEDMVMTDVCPFTLGISTCREIRGQVHDGYYMPIIHRNTTIPVSKEEIISTLYPGQTELLIQVYQGEARKTENNISLGELAIQGLPKTNSHTEANIRFTYDLNGILDVEAYIPSTGKKYKTVLTNNVASLSETEIDAAVKKMQDLKFYPRDKAENKNLLLFAEKTLEELNRFQREELERSIAYFEDALSSGEKDYFEKGRNELLITLSRLGFTYDMDEQE